MIKYQIKIFENQFKIIINLFNGLKLLNPKFKFNFLKNQIKMIAN